MAGLAMLVLAMIAVLAVLLGALLVGDADASEGEPDFEEVEGIPEPRKEGQVIERDAAERV